MEANNNPQGNEYDNWMVVLGTAHLESTKGKCSPDFSIREYAYSREVCQGIYNHLVKRGVGCVIDLAAKDLPIDKRKEELQSRVGFVNNLVKVYDAATPNAKMHVIYVSVHLNAAPPADGKWHKAQGWSVFVANSCSAQSLALANYLFDAAKAKGLTTRQPYPFVHYWRQGLYVLRKTLCPAVLTENLFQDNREDVEFLKSSLGFRTIVQLHVQGILSYIEAVNNDERRK